MRVGYFHPAEKKPKMVDNLRAVLSRRGFTEQEISVFRGVIKSLDAFPRRWPKRTEKSAEGEGTPTNGSGDND